ncbi:MAG: zinc-dependent metalloprotease [bacterium]|nr:zinc-dependent metalloprotease [bacterium]
MFESMQFKYFIFLFFSLLTAKLFAQDIYCPTQQTSEQLQKLKVFQQKLDLNGPFLGKKAIQYVPFKIHIIGNSKGVGYYQTHQIMNTLCELNERFIPTGFHFYLAGQVSYINDDELYVGSSDAIWTRSGNYKLNGAVNVFFHGAGMQWCGVYFGGVDVVFIKNSCQGTNATTLTHELGHFFGLPHTFYGWEGDNVPSNIEKLDQTNCRNAGDGFCDTKADYVSQRWGCPLSWTLKDPNGISFKPDSSMYMSYSSDNCQSRFSQEQMQAMQSDLQSRNIAKGIADTRVLANPIKVFPTPNQSKVNAQNVMFKWQAVEGAFAYHLQIARFGDWNYLNVDQLIYDTSALVQLYGEWPYAWRVKAFTAANTCAPFGVVDTFTTYVLPAGVKELSLNSGTNVFPNPVKANEKILIQCDQTAQIQIYNSLGQLAFEGLAEHGLPFQCTLTQTGLYFISVRTEQGFQIKRLLVN